MVRTVPSQATPKAALSLCDPSGEPIGRWPFLLRRMQGLLQGLSVGRLVVTLPDGSVLTIEGKVPGPHGQLSIYRWRALQRAGLQGDVGLGEAFMDGDWDSPNLAETLLFFAANTAETGDQFTPSGLWGWLLAGYHRLRANTRFMARRNIAAHYDLGNDFYATWLDPTMTYSAALFAEGANSLEEAQIAKYRALASATGLGAEDHVLEIGCGWGGFAVWAAQNIGCSITAVTLSKAQHDYAQARIERAGVSDRITLLLQDYRSLTGQFDHVISIEMIEAVGEAYWPVYFAKVASLLRPGGRFGLQAITINDADFSTYRRRPDFLQTHIFPGGMLLPAQGMRQIAGSAGLKAEPARSMGLDYAQTLAIWHSQFNDAWPELEAQGFDFAFRRKWQFYLAMCEAGFRSGLIDVSQTVFVSS